MDTEKLDELKAGILEISGMAEEIRHGRERACQRRRERKELSILVHTSDGASKLIVALGVLLVLFIGALVAVLAIYGLAAVFVPEGVPGAFLLIINFF